MGNIINYFETLLRTDFFFMGNLRSGDFFFFFFFFNRLIAGYFMGRDVVFFYKLFIKEDYISTQRKSNRAILSYKKLSAKQKKVYLHIQIHFPWNHRYIDMKMNPKGWSRQHVLSNNLPCWDIHQHLKRKMEGLKCYDVVESIALRSFLSRHFYGIFNFMQ